MAMAAEALMSESRFEVDKLTHEIFSILESKFLFGYSDPKLFLTDQKSDSCVETVFGELKSSRNISGKVRILSIDDGGDGILAGKSLTHLEAYLRVKSGNPDARIADFFDIAAGSGVGGVLAALLFTKGTDDRPLFKADEALQFLVDNCRKLTSSPTGIFRRINRRSKAERILRKTFGESTTLRDTLKPILISCYDLSTRAPFLFSRADAFESDAFDFAIADACAATLADPTATGALEMRSVDKKTRISAVGSGLAMNNPTAAAITHVLNNKHEFPFCNGVRDLLVVSLGNGESDSARRDLMTPSPAALVKIAGEGASDMVDQAVAMAFGEVKASNYVRIQANGFNNNKYYSAVLKGKSNSTSDGKNLKGIEEEVLRQKNVESVLFRGKKVVEKTNLEQLELFAGELIKEHERRKSSVFPIVVFKQASPRTSSATVSTISSY